MRTRHFAFTALAFSLSAFQGAHAAGFAMTAQSASGLGMAYADGATNTTNASALWSNPAAITELRQAELSIAGHLLNIGYKFTNRGSTLPVPIGAGDISDNGTVDAGGLSLVPAVFYTQPFNERLSLGFGINVPFGSNTEYDPDWAGRYQTVASEVAAINLMPSLAYRFSDQLSVGASLIVQHIEATLTTAVDSGSLCLSSGVSRTTTQQAECLAAGLTPGNVANDSLGEVNGDNWTAGFSLGTLYKLNDRTSIGASYRSKFDQTIDGDADFTVNQSLASILSERNIPLLQDGAMSAKAALPAMLSLSGAHRYNNRLTLAADATWTQWSNFEELRVVYENPVQPDTLTTQNWNNVWRYSLGGSYQLDDQWLLRAGLAYDESPIPSLAYRTARIPGNDRTWLSVGATYQLSADLDVDMALTQLFIDQTPLDHTNEDQTGDKANGYTVRGVYDTNVTLLGLQLNWRM